jgi:ribonuclease P protein subunit RPR2
MVRIARDRVARLFALADQERSQGDLSRSHRYVRLARRIGMRYTVRISGVLREQYCRSCSAYWVEGRTVTTRLRGGIRVRTCRVCHRIRRTRLTPRPEGPPQSPDSPSEAEVAVPVDTTIDDEGEIGEPEEE